MTLEIIIKTQEREAWLQDILHTYIMCRAQYKLLDSIHGYYAVDSIQLALCRM